jgi:hypothetical protein
VRGYNAKKDATVHLGWTLLPVFDPHTKFVASGHYHLPLFSGAVSEELLLRLADVEEADVNALVRHEIETASLQLAKGSVLVCHHQPYTPKPTP